MNPAELQQPILDSGTRSINFFNGRLLTARDLTREQAANREVDKQLGQAIGDGVAHGFEVSTSKSPQSTTGSPRLTITPGLAINRRGQTLRLESETDIALVRDPNANTPASSFKECVPLQAGIYRAGEGVYLLTVSPAQTTEGLATVSGLDRAIASCNTDTIVSTLQFRLVQLNPPLTDADLDDENHLRNLLAYKCFGVEDLKSSVSDPFSVELTKYGLLDSLRPNRLTDCDVPLAVLYWTLADGVKFVDMWSVRRRLVQHSPTTSMPVIADRLLSEGEAMIAQFGEQLAALSTSVSNLPNVKATDYFKLLPPVGLIPLNVIGGAGGFDYQKFFEGMKYWKPVFVEGAKVKSLLRMAVSYPPVDVNSGKLIWLYWVRENMQKINDTIINQPRPYMIFSNGYIPFQGDARYDLSHWDYSNYV